MKGYITFLSWTSLFALGWLLLLGLVEPSFGVAITILALVLLGAFTSLPRSDSEPPSGGNGRHVRRKR